MQTQGDKNLTNVNTGIFLKIENCAGGHIICRLNLIFRSIQLLHPCHTSTIVVGFGSNSRQAIITSMAWISYPCTNKI